MMEGVALTVSRALRRRDGGWNLPARIRVELLPHTTDKIYRKAGQSYKRWNRRRGV